MSMSRGIIVGIIGGTGLDGIDILKNRRVKKKYETPFGVISDDLIFGQIQDVQCILLARHGRLHNIMPGNVNYRANIWALKEQGCTHIIASTATGSLHEKYAPGEIVILDNFIDRTQARKQTFYDGLPGHPSGICHVQMEPAFNEELREVISMVASDMHLRFHKTGTIVTIEGPRFSSRAESKMFRSWGAHVINMTSVPEVILAKEAGICYASIALITDYDCWRDEHGSVCVSDVVGTMKENCDVLTQLILAVVPALNQLKWDRIINQLNEMVKKSTMI